MRYSALGTIVGAAFGGAWFYYATALAYPNQRIAGVAASVLLAAAFALVAIVRGRPTPLFDTQAGGNRPRTSLKFAIVVIVEVLALNVAWNVLLAIHHPEFIVAAVAIVVGLHFIPLARIFRLRIYYVPAIVMTAAGVLAAFTLWNAFCCLCCALALWTAVSIRPSIASASAAPRI